MTSAEFKEIRIKSGHSQASLGAVIYLSARQIRRIEKGASISLRVKIEMEKIRSESERAPSQCEQEAK